jgi:phage terminase large subunit-like protein
MFDQAKAERAIRFIECLKLTGDYNGQPFILVDWMRQIIRDVYGTMNERRMRQYREIWIEVAKKNAKSQLGSGIGVFHLFNKAEPHGLIFLCAGDQEQARQTIYDPLVEMLDQAPELIKRLRIRDSTKEILNKETGTELKVISSEAYTKHGPKGSCVIFDEFHVQPNRALYDTMTHGAGLARREPIWWFLTTAGDDPDRTSIAWEVHQLAMQVLEARRTGDKRKDIPTWYPVIYAYTGEDIYNEENWKQANPSLGTALHIEDLRDLALQAKLSPAKERLFRWLNLDQWVTTKLTSWLPLELWDATEGSWSLEEMDGEDCFLGGDFSTTIDLSAVCLIFPPQKEHADWRVCWEAWIPEESLQERVEKDHVPYNEWAAAGYLTPTEGSMIDYDMIEAEISGSEELEMRGIKTQYNVKEMGADKSFAAMLLQRLGKKGIMVVDVPQRVSELTDPMNQIEILMREGKLTHEKNPLARWCFGNTQIYMNGNRQIKFVKEHHGATEVRTKRIDLTAAWVNGMARAKFYTGRVDINERVNSEDWGM